MSKIVLLAFALVTTLVATTTTACSRNAIRPKPPVGDRELYDATTRLYAHEMRKVLRDGDFIVARSYSDIGTVIVAATPGVDVSHSAMYDAERDSIIESVRPVVRETSLETLIARNHYLYIVRPAYRDNADAHQTIVRARSVLGAKYDRSGLVGWNTKDEYTCADLLFWSADMRTRGFSDGLILAPSKIFTMGETVYFSGARGSEDVNQSARDLMQREQSPMIGMNLNAQK